MSFSQRVEGQYLEMLKAAGAGAEKQFRERAWEAYSRMGLPDRKTETWKYSNLTPVTGENWELSEAQKPLLTEAQALRARWQNEFEILVMIDGRMRPELSTFKDARLSTFTFSEQELRFEDGWVGMAASVARPGFNLSFEAGYRPAKPILILHAQSSGQTWSPVVNHISLGVEAHLEVAEMHLGVAAHYLRSEITSVVLGAGATLDWVRIQNESAAALHFSEVQARLSERACLSVTQLNGGSLWSRSNLRADIQGAGAEAHISGLTFARGRQHVDQRVEVRHAKGPGISTQLFKGVLKDFARGILNGKILIERDAQKVVSSQLNHNLLLSKTAEADTKPELEIYADDVKANHGASVGRLDEDKVFYLMSRGISRREAQQMLARAFVGDVLMKIRPARLRAFAEACVQDWLPEFSADMEHI